MAHNEYKWQTSGGITGYAQSWAPDGEVKAVVCIVHGHGEHSGRYNHMVDYFVPKGYVIFSFDQRGHGKTTGQRGHAKSMDVLLNDVDEFVDMARKLWVDKPIFMLGHSMGGNIAINYVLQRQPAINGLIATSSYLKLAFAPPAWKVALGKFMAGIIPSLSQPTGLDASTISRDKSEVDKYVNDPLVHSKMSAALFVALTKGGEYAIANADKLNVPTLIMHGSGDKLTSYAGSEEFVRNSGGKAEFKGWPEVYHEAQNDYGKEEVFAFEEQWMEKHM